MSYLSAGRYHTAAGSTLEVSGKHEGIFEVFFDWFEEGACLDCVADAQPDEDGNLHWYCEQHDGGKAKWIEGAA